MAACCPNVDAVDVSYEVEALGCIHDLKGEVVMHERRRIGRRRSTGTLHTTIPPTLIIDDHVNMHRVIIEKGLHRIVAVPQIVDIAERA